MSIARGHDPRRFALVAIGGAGPMHACALADELGIPRVVVPRYPGVAAALGLLATDIRHDLRRSWLVPTAATTPERVDAELAELEAEGRRLLERSSAVADAFEVTYELDMRYRGQAYNLTVPLAPRPVTATTLRGGRARLRGGARAPLRLHAERHRDRDRDPAACARSPARPSSTGSPASPRSPPPRPAAACFDGSWSRVDGAAARRAAAGRRDRVADDRGAGGRHGRRAAPAGAAASRPGAPSSCSGRTPHEQRRRSTRHPGDPRERLPPHRGGDGGRGVPLVLLADHPRDARLQLRAVHRRRAHGRELRADPGPARPDAVRAGGGDREVGRRRARRATRSSPTTRTWAARTRPTCRSSRRCSPAGRIVAWAGLDRPPHRHRRPLPGHRERAVHGAVPGGADLPGPEAGRGGPAGAGAVRADRRQRARPRTRRSATSTRSSPPASAG